MLMAFRLSTGEPSSESAAAAAVVVVDGGGACDMSVWSVVGGWTATGGIVCSDRNLVPCVGNDDGGC